MYNMNFLVVLALIMVHAIEATPDVGSAMKHHGNECRPENLIGDSVVSCERLGKSVPAGDLYTDYGLHYNPMLSPYYAARFADALGYDNCCLGNNTTFLKRMNVMTPWSGIHGGIAVDGIFGFDRNILRRCVFPTAKYPFLCTGSAGNPGTQGKNLGTLSYISLLHDNTHHKWTLFGQCWNAKTPTNPHAKPTATSFNVFSLEPKLPPADRKAIIAKLREIGFSTYTRHYRTRLHQRS